MAKMKMEMIRAKTLPSLYDIDKTYVSFDSTILLLVV